jgi:WhiB family redox-sensing transcriptional regulator
MSEYRWQDHGACRGMDAELFFPVQGESHREAVAVCGGCLVRGDCLAYSLEAGEKFGIWGGVSERGRKRMRSSPGQLERRAQTDLAADARYRAKRARGDAGSAEVRRGRMAAVMHADGVETATHLLDILGALEPVQGE